jgi:hypothetical protein
MYFLLFLIKLLKFNIKQIKEYKMRNTKKVKYRIFLFFFFDKLNIEYSLFPIELLTKIGKW